MSLKVVIYGAPIIVNEKTGIETSSCFGCKKTKELFAKNGVDIDYHTPEDEDYDKAINEIKEKLGYFQSPAVLVHESNVAIWDSDGILNVNEPSLIHWSGLNPLKIKEVSDLIESAA